MKNKDFATDLDFFALSLLSISEGMSTKEFTINMSRISDAAKHGRGLTTVKEYLRLVKEAHAQAFDLGAAFDLAWVRLLRAQGEDFDCQ